MLAKALQGAALATIPQYIEDVFSTYLYTGNGSTQTITNGIDLAGKGGLVWIKSRGQAYDQMLYDTARGAGKYIRSNSTAAEISATTYQNFTSFNSTGFSLGAASVGPDQINANNDTLVSWTFRKQAKFFDVVTYTGNGANRTIAHNLGSTPGCIIVKRTDTTSNWQVYHNSLTSAAYGIQLNLTNAQASDTTLWNSTAPTSTVFSLGTNVDVNANGGTYVAYLFAHNAGGFGANGTDNVISCGSFTGVTSVNLGYEPQFLLIKNVSSGSWYTYDNMRGWTSTGEVNVLSPDNATAEASYTGNIYPTSTGFYTQGAGTSTYIYIAIRRGPMRTPTSGTSVFEPALGVTSSTAPFMTVNTSFTVDAHFMPYKAVGAKYEASRLQGTGQILVTNTTAAEVAADYPAWDRQTGVGSNVGNSNFSNYIAYNFRRAPGFFDVVCYTGTGTTLNPSHNLSVVPELKIIKRRETAAGWLVGGTIVTENTQNDYLMLDTNAAKVSSTTYWSSGNDSSTTFSTRTGNSVSNASGSTYVAYLFATVTGVSKVGSYTGNGSSQTINCGFAAGARFVMIKRTDSTGDWYVWDTARGIVAGNDPHLSLNTTAVEVTTDDTIDPDNSGFIVNQVAATNVNVSSATYIFLAVS